MSSSFPISLDNLPSPSANNPLDNPPHATLHINSNDAISTVQTKVGIDGSTDPNSLDYKVNQLMSSGNFVPGEVLTGQNGVKTDFVLTYTPVSGKVVVFQNGIRMTLTSDYTISGSTIHFLTAPLAIDTLIVDYFKA